MSANDEENLSTDAYPSPPRSDVDEESNSASQHEATNTNNRRHSESSSKGSNRHRENSESDDSDPLNPRKCCNRRRYSSKSHDGYQGPNAYASVINISNATGIQIGSNYTYHINCPDQKPMKKNKDIPKTEKIILLLNSEKTVTEKDVQFLSAHIDSTWMETARKLDYSEGQISQFYCDFINNGLKEVIYQFLLDWIRNNGKNATVSKLANALWNSDQKQSVVKWSQE